MSAHKIATKTCIFYEDWNCFKMGAPVKHYPRKEMSRFFCLTVAEGVLHVRLKARECDVYS